MSEFEDALGVYVGSASYEEVVAALRDAPKTSILAARIDDRESRSPGEGVRFKVGYADHYYCFEDDEASIEGHLFVIHGHQEALGYGVIYQDAPLVLELAEGYPSFDADRYSGGVRLRSAFGTVIDIAVWHPIMHMTESGDLAPGTFGAEVERIEPDEGDA